MYKSFTGILIFYLWKIICEKNKKNTETYNTNATNNFI